MGHLTEFLFKSPASQVDQQYHQHHETTTPFDGAPSSSLESSLYNLMESFEQSDVTDSPAAAVCKLHVPAWLNLWCVMITVCVLAVLVILGVLVRYVQQQKRRQSRAECYHCFPASPEFYSEHYLDRSHILVY